MTTVPNASKPNLAGTGCCLYDCAAASEQVYSELEECGLVGGGCKDVAWVDTSLLQSVGTVFVSMSVSVFQVKTR